VPAIRDVLARAMPELSGEFERRADAYLARVRALDEEIARCIDSVPPVERTLVTSHDAFERFAKRYGIRVVGAIIPAQSTQAQPSAGEIQQLAQLVRRERVKAIFPEASVNAKLAEALARETGARSDLTLYGDTLGPKGSSGDTYLKMEAANADALVRGFTGGARGCR
jgi:zinc/manganese transport system substrate-binding protein